MISEYKIRRLQHRSKHEIYSQIIIAILKNPMITKTELSEKTNIQRTPLMNYLNTLLKNRLVIDGLGSNTRSRYIVTNKGEQFLDEWDNLCKRYLA